MLEAQAKQFRLNDEGIISYQKDASNPLPGEAMARMVKGVSMMAPAVMLLETSAFDGLDRAAVKKKLEEWLVAHIEDVLEPLANLKKLEDGVELPPPAMATEAKESGKEDGKEAENAPAAEPVMEETPAPVLAIARRLYETLGIVPRKEIEEPIGQLDERGRQILRRCKVRLGPVLVFMPLLNKPAAVHLRAILWALWHEKSLPPKLPADGIVSWRLDDDQAAEWLYYRSIGYPVYGQRAIRADMLDRLISSVYEHAQKGKFQARHEMAEWLGCSIPDLYEVLESMGHKKIHDPADHKDETKPDEAEKPADKAVQEEKPEESPKESVPSEKPELAVFLLRRGKAYGSKRPDYKSEKPKGASRPKGKKHHKKPEKQTPRIISSGPDRKLEDSPFAVLKDLKVGNKGD